MQRKQNRRHTTLLQQRLYIGQCWYVLSPPWRVTLLWWLHRWYRKRCRYRLLPPLLSCYLSFGWWQSPFGMSWIPPLQAYPFRGCTPVWCGRNREQQGTKGKRAMVSPTIQFWSWNRSSTCSLVRSCLQATSAKGAWERVKGRTGGHGRRWV